jgi:hypothetical protein
MLKIRSKLEFVIEGKLFQFECDPDSSLAAAKEALIQCLNFLGKIDEKAKEKQAQEEAAQKASQPVSEEVPQESKVEPLPQDSQAV